MTVKPSTIGSTPSRVSRPPATSSATAASSTVPTVAAGMPPSTDSESGVQAVEPDAMLLTSGCGPTSAQALYAFAVSTLNWSAAERTSPTRPTTSARTGTPAREAGAEAPAAEGAGTGDPPTPGG